MKKRKIALITGFNGQDGFYLNKILKDMNYKVYGLIRKKNLDIKEKNIIKTDYSFKHIDQIIKKIKPDEVYNFASQSFPFLSWKDLNETLISINDITKNLLIILQKSKKKFKFFNSSSAEIFAESKSKLNENSKIFPINPYGCAKAFSHFMVCSFRENYKLFALNGIFFNHDSIKSNNNFLLKKIVTTAIDIKNGKKKYLYLNSLKPVRDFGHAEDYMIAAYKIMQQKKPRDFIIGSGKYFNVGDIAKIVFDKLNIDHMLIKEKKIFNFKTVSKKIPSIKKIKRFTKWTPKRNIDDIIDELINYEMKKKN